MNHEFNSSNKAHSAHTMERSLKIYCAIAVIVILIVTAYLFIDSESFMPSCSACDVAGYWMVAQHYSIYGLLGPLHGYANIRTYVFPGLLSVLLSVAGPLHANPRALLAGIQVVTFISSCWFLAKTATRQGQMQTLAFIGLVCNPFVVPYLVTGLADSAALIAFQFWLGLMLLHWRHAVRYTGQLKSISSFWIIAAAFVAGLTMEIRPAYVWLPPVTLLCALWLPATPPSNLWLNRLNTLLVCAAVTMLPMIPQSIINSHHFDRWTPLLVANLQNYQVTLGKSNIKFMTRVDPGTDGGASEGFGLLYPNPFYDADEDTSPKAKPMTWYPDHPVPALLTIVAKFTSIFDFDFVEPYVRTIKPNYQLAFRFASLGLLFFGICGIVGHLVGLLGRTVAIGPALFPTLILTAWGAVTMVTVPELRYSLPMLPVLSLLALALLVEVAKRSWRVILLAAIALVASVTALLSIANFVRDVVPLR